MAGARRGCGWVEADDADALVVCHASLAAEALSSCDVTGGFGLVGGGDELLLLLLELPLPGQVRIPQAAQHRHRRSQRTQKAHGGNGSESSEEATASEQMVNA